MKTKFTTTLILLFLVQITGYSQLKVAPNGCVGLGFNNPGGAYKLEVKGNLLLSNYPTTPFYELNLKVGNGSPGAEIGASAGTLAVWSSAWGWNNLMAGSFLKQSDSTIKSNIYKIDNGLGKVLKLKSVSYEINRKQVNEFGKEQQTVKREFGFLAQDIQKQFPNMNITDTAKGIILMDYDQIIPLTVAAIQEQQNVIDSLTDQLSKLNKKIELLSNVSTASLFSNDSKINDNILLQNKPNPFYETTVIEYIVKNEGFKASSISVFDMNGTLLKTYPISQPGRGQILIHENEFKAGMYMYSLIVNNQEIQTKRMILLNQ